MCANLRSTCCIPIIQSPSTLLTTPLKKFETLCETVVSRLLIFLPVLSYVVADANKGSFLC